MSITLPIDFPPELVQEFLRYAARLSTGFCLTLCRVSSWTRRLALPYLYSTVILKTYAHSNHFLECLFRSPFSSIQPHFDPKKAVRSLWLEPVQVLDSFVSVFEECDNLTNIALHGDNLLWLVYTSSAEGLNRLSHDTIMRKQDLDLVIVKGNEEWDNSFFASNPALNTPVFHKIARLRLTRIDDYERRLRISHFSRLTHFAVPCYNDAHNISLFNSRVLGHSFLEVFVIVLYWSRDDIRAKVQQWVQETRKIERSLKVYVVESGHDVTEVRKGWEEEVRGGQSFWDKAALSSIF
jgi:hypothetical protein